MGVGAVSAYLVLVKSHDYPSFFFTISWISKAQLKIAWKILMLPFYLVWNLPGKYVSQQHLSPDYLRLGICNRPNAKQSTR